MKKKIVSILLNQYFLAAIISLLIIQILPDFFSKYKIELAERDTLSREGFRVYFEDLNNDSNSEKIICYNNNLGNASFEIHGSEGGLIDQWNFSKELNSGLATLYFFDANENGFNEVYLFTQKQDSIFLNISEPFVEQGIEKSDIFIDVIKEFNNEYKSGVIPLCLGNKTNNKIKDVYFNISSGFSGSPRNVYKYNYTTNEVIKSPHLTNTLSIKFIKDINGDGEEEIVLRGYANCNEIDSIYTNRSDYSSWITVLDTNLNFIFEPIEVKIPFSSVTPLAYEIGTAYKLVTLIDSRNNEYMSDRINIYSIQGELESSIPIPSGRYRKFEIYDQNKILLHNADNGKVVLMNSKFKEVKNIFLLNKWELRSIDIDLDGKEEHLNLSKDYQNITIYRNNFTHPISFEIPKLDFDFLYSGVIHNEKNKNGLYFQKGNEYFVYSYAENKLYVFKYLIYTLIFLGVFGLVWLISQGQKIRMEKKLAIQAEIAEYQIKTIKNQVDPHFVFNAINTISGLMLEDDKIKADEFICQFSDLMRMTLENSDKITCTLIEELNYVKNYLNLQQTRFNNKFQYKINIEDGVNKRTIIPKHILYTYVENAIKHSLSASNHGELFLGISDNKKQLVFVIENRSEFTKNLSKNKMNSTGNGLLIMDKIYFLYKKLYKKNIEHSVEKVLNEQQQEIGYKVTVLISK